MTVTFNASTIETVSGRGFDLLRPDSESVDIFDIAHGLSNICRYSGQCRIFYSVAEHSVKVWELVVEECGHGDIALAALLHDAAEAYVTDLPRPLKIHDTFYREVEDRIHKTIALALDINWSTETKAIVKKYDNTLLISEAKVLLPSKGEGWDLVAGWEIGKAQDVVIDGLSPDAAKARFIDAYFIEINS